MKIKIFYNHKEELWNSWSHAGGIFLGVAFGAIFLYLCFSRGNGWATAGVILYLVGMLGSYIASTVYHALSAWSPWKERLRKWDHAAIYWHIAGSYSPITLIALRQEGYWGWTLFCFVMGMSVLIAFKPLIDSVSAATVIWIIAEGVCYVTGALFYTLRRRRYMHTVFHFFVLAGSVCHLIAVWDILMRYL